MNEIVSVPKPSIAAGGSISSIVPQNLDEAFRLSTAIHQAGMSPYGIDTPQKVMIAMLAGLELGLPPMQAVQSIAVINNRPCMWGDGLIGVVRRNPVCLYVKEWLEGEEDHRIAYCETKRRGEDAPVTRSFSVPDAKRAGLWQTKEIVRKKRKDGSFYETANDSPWFKYPQRMLQMRARAWCLRDVYPDVLKGMHAREEVEDFTTAESEPVAALPPLEERLRIARAEPQSEVQDAQEGFDAAFVEAETQQAISGLAIEQEPEPSPVPSPLTPTGDAGSEPDHPLPPPAEPSADAAGQETGGEAQDNPVAPSVSTSDLVERNLMVEAIDKFIRVATDPSVPDARARQDNLIATKNAWKLELKNRPDFVKACTDIGNRLIKGEIETSEARETLERFLP